MMETKSTELTIGQTVAVDNVEEIVYGTIIESNNGEVAVREWTFTDEEWLPSEAVYDFPLEEVTADNFLFKSIVQEYNLDDTPSSEEAQGIDNVTTIKSKDYEMTEQDFEVLVKSIAKLVIAEVGVKVDTMPMAMMEPDDMATDQADVMGASLGLAPGLQALMGNIVPLYFASHRAHWNVQGTDFSEYHELFEEIYSDIYSSIDPLAENIRKIGAFPQSLMTMMMNAEVKDDTITTDARELAADLISKNLDVLELLKEVFKACDEMDEQGIANFIAERIDMHEKWNWQLSASVAAPGTNAPKAAEEGEVKEDSEVETEVKAEEAEAEEATSEEAAVEEAAAECTNEEHADGCCGAAEEKAAFLTLNDLKEFSDLLDML
jgi:starvation-inducible DNA-binding protein